MCYVSERYVVEGERAKCGKEAIYYLVIYHVIFLEHYVRPKHVHKTIQV